MSSTTAVTSIASTRENSLDREVDHGKQQQHHRQSLSKNSTHLIAIHAKSRPSTLGHDAHQTPSFLGFRNLMVLALIVMNLRLVVENFLKYGVLICIKCHDYRRQDLILLAVLYAMIPCHLFAALSIEVAAAGYARGIIGRQKKKEEGDVKPSKHDHTWKFIALAHGLNATLCLAITSFVVYYGIHHPLIGTMTELHAIITWLKICSYAFTNRDLRHAMLRPGESSILPEVYSTCQYPNNVTLGNLCYFWWAPTLVYQPVYPRTSHIRWGFFTKRLAELVGLSIFIWLTSAQYAAPTLANSLNKVASMDIGSIIERLMKLSIISSIIWLAGFFAVFQSALNALAEIMRFGDREFYTDWWNAPSVGAYWRNWNKPVYNFMKRHIFLPLLARGWSPVAASAMVFIFSGILHELLVGIPTHNILGRSFPLPATFIFPFFIPNPSTPYLQPNLIEKLLLKKI